MPRSLVLGNSRFFINFDERYWIRDVYFPHLGIENHSEGYAFRFGVWVDDRMSWLEAPAWRIDIRYDSGTLVSSVSAVNAQLQLELTIRDAIDYELDVFAREVTIHDRSGRDRNVRVVHHHDFHIAGSEVGDTALYDPDIGGIIHYKRDRYFLIGGGIAPQYQLTSFATGKKRFAGAEGTWRDAEDDGVLSGNPIAQGSVDSTIAIDAHVPMHGMATTYYWIAAGERYGDLLRLNSRLRRLEPHALIERTAAYWRLWLHRTGAEFYGLDDDIVELFRTSLLIMRAHTDEGGAIIAALDSDIINFARDTYGYMWPRDGALVADAFDAAGYVATTRRFFRFAVRLLKREGYFLHKYHPDRSLASSWHPWIDAHGNKMLPIQEDETGLVVWALWRHFERYGDVEEVQPHYRSFVLRAAEFMVGYRDTATGLPLPSWDLWEERRGTLTFTCAAVWAGLDAAARFAAAFGEESTARRFRHAADEIRDGIVEHLWDEQHGRFLRMLGAPEPGAREPLRDATADASLFGLHFLGVFPAGDERLRATLESIARELTVDTAVGGLARYHGDYYHAVSDDWGRVPGNPWFIAQCWLARWRIAGARSDAELASAIEPLRWVAARASPARLLAEQLDPFSGSPLAVSPLTWSHATFVSAVLDYVARHERRGGSALGAVTRPAPDRSVERGLH